MISLHISRKVVNVNSTLQIAMAIDSQPPPGGFDMFRLPLLFGGVNKKDIATKRISSTR